MPEAPETLRAELERLLANRPAHIGDAIRRIVTDVRPCVRLETRRVAGSPLEASFVDRILGRRPAAPVLPRVASKFGGLPYVEDAVDFDRARFIGQINFAEVRAALVREGFAMPNGLPDVGILAIDLIGNSLHGRVRWYAAPAETKAGSLVAAPCVAKYEAAIEFRGSWSLRGLEWFDAVPEGDDELWVYLNDLEIPGVDEDRHHGHKLLGHPNEALNEHYGFTRAPERSASIREYELLWRIDFDNRAGFAWGTNWLYIVIHRDDLARGALENAVVTAANA